MEQKSLLSMDEVLFAVKGKKLNLAQKKDSFYFDSVVTDSRQVKKGSFFVPLIGEFQNGHKYIESAFANGATVSFVQKSEYESNAMHFMNILSDYPESSIVVVENNLYALQNLAEFYASKFKNLIRVAVTGSSGKTTTRELLTAILSQKYKVVSTQGNFNSETGLPLSMFSIKEEHELGIFEMGMNRKNEIFEIAKVFKPQYAVITNIGIAHVGLLGSRQNIAQEKKHIFDFFTDKSIAVLPAEDDFRSFLEEGVPGKKIYFGASTNNSSLENGRVKFICDKGLDGTLFSVDNLEMCLKLPGIYNFYDAQAAILLALELGLNAQQIKAGIESVTPLFGRSQIIRGKYTIIQDCYNANPDSMEKSIEFFSSVTCSGKKILLLGDMFELGTSSLTSHAQICRIAIRSSAYKIFFVGQEFYKLNTEFSKEKNIRFIKTLDENSIKDLVLELKSILSENDILLCKASRSMGLERIVCALGENNE